MLNTDNTSDITISLSNISSCFETITKLFPFAEDIFFLFFFLVTGGGGGGGAKLRNLRIDFVLTLFLIFVSDSM